MKVPSYRRHASGQAKVTIAGKDYLIGPWKSKESKEKYDRLVGEYISSGRSKSFRTKPSELSIAELLFAFKAHAAQTYGVSKRGEYYQLRLAMRPLKRLYSSTQAIEFGVPQWKAVRRYIEDGKNGALSMGASAVRLGRTDKSVLDSKSNSPLIGLAQSQIRTEQAERFT